MLHGADTGTASHTRFCPVEPSKSAKKPVKASENLTMRAFSRRRARCGPCLLHGTKIAILLTTRRNLFAYSRSISMKTKNLIACAICGLFANFSQAAIIDFNSEATGPHFDPYVINGVQFTDSATNF